MNILTLRILEKQLDRMVLNYKAAGRKPDEEECERMLRGWVAATDEQEFVVDTKCIKEICRLLTIAVMDPSFKQIELRVQESECRNGETFAGEMELEDADEEDDSDLSFP